MQWYSIPAGQEIGGRGETGGGTVMSQVISNMHNRSIIRKFCEVEMIRAVPAKEGDTHVFQTSPLPLYMLVVKIKFRLKFFNLIFLCLLALIFTPFFVCVGRFLRNKP